MSTSINAVLGVLFLFLGFLTTYLMFQFWGYPYDHEKKKSSCPQWKMNIHRACGFAYLAIYIVLMIQMVPRMWTYQVELPARTVAHIVCGLGIGVILVVKISIIRFFRHLEELMPALGITLLTLTVILSGLSLPFAFKERALAAGAKGGGVVSAENRQRVADKLAGIDFGAKVDVAGLATASALQKGREVLLTDCVYCHDLRTAISRPRTAGDWWRTVSRMAKKPTLGPQLELEEQHQVTAYLVAITPELQDSAKEKRVATLKKKETEKALENSMAQTDGGKTADGGDSPPVERGAEPVKPVVDMAKAKDVYEDLCSQCHELSDVDDEPPKTDADVIDVIQRMVDNGLEAEQKDLDLVRAYMMKVFVSGAK